MHYIGFQFDEQKKFYFTNQHKYYAENVAYRKKFDLDLHTECTIQSGFNTDQLLFMDGQLLLGT